MIAILKTRCGCVRMLVVLGHPEYIYVPLEEPYGALCSSKEEAESLQANSRRFRAINHGWLALGGPPTEEHAFYLEM